MFGVRGTSDSVLLVVPSSSSVWKPRLLEEIAGNWEPPLQFECSVEDILPSPYNALKTIQGIHKAFLPFVFQNVRYLNFIAMF